MFRLSMPIASACPVSDFDDISTILTHSSLTGSKKSAPWQQHIGEDGHVFYVELDHGSHTETLGSRKTDASSVCSLCSTRSCHSCASEDTGYSSDTDVHSTQSRNRKSDHSVLDLSHDSLGFHSRVGDFEDVDDGVSVDLQDFERSEQTRVKLDPVFDDSDFFKQVTRECNGESRSSQRSARHHRSLGCTRTSSLCERHSNKLCVPGHLPPPSDFTRDHHQTCKCGGQLGSMSVSKGRSSDARQEIVLHLRPSGHAWDGHSRVGWLESVLGIVTGHGHAGNCQGQRKDGGDRVVVKGLTPDGPALKCRELLIGDQIHSINGKQVTWSNLDTVVSCLHQTRKVRLSVERADSSHQLLPSPATDRLLLDTGGVLKALLDRPSTTITTSSPTSPRRRGEGLEGVSVVYMSMEGVRSDERGEKDEDVVYQYPRGDSLLARLRGSFFTLHHLLTPSADGDIRMLTVGVSEMLVNVACYKEGEGMLIVTAPAKRLHSSQLQTVTSGMLRLVRLLFGTVGEAFGMEQHHESLDDFFSFLFTSLKPTIKGTTSCVQNSLLGYMDYLPLPDDVAVSISNTLTEYESADFADMSDSFYGCRRAFTVLGSMVLYKGRITCSHLCPQDATDVGLYLQHSGLLALSTTRSLHQLLVWREVFPNRLCHEVAGTNNVFGYSEPHARWYLMVVGVKNTLLACILEAGGCSTQFEGVRLPDPFYVDQARAALVQLQTADIVSACEIRLSGDGLPATTSADKLLAQHLLLDSPHRVLDNFVKSTASLALSLNNNHHANGLVGLSNSSMLTANGVSYKGGRGEWRMASMASDGSSESGGSNEGYLKNTRRKGRLYPPAQSSALIKPSFVIDSDINTCKLSSGKENSLLVFCQVNEQEGVLITSPADSEDSGGLQQQVVENFYRCAARIHSDFSKVKAKYSSESLLEDFHGDRSLRSCHEEGVLFTCSLPDRADSKKPPTTLAYWVVGRKFRNIHSREVYVCFHESAQQNVIELAFRLSLGSLSST
ncbi:hypothetical protein V1264_004046 [Littorina saxatilis]|uniref:Inturned planar cell polarity effector homolog n=1 Tax=Littorina saxatilis TaxID=31220 RepID=A0AAN9B0T7_9CAEN